MGQHMLDHSQGSLSPWYITILHRNVLNQIQTATNIDHFISMCGYEMRNAAGVQARLSSDDQCSSSSVIAFANGN